MRGTKPDQQTAEGIEQALSNLRIDLPKEERAVLQRKEDGSPDRSAQQSRKPAVVKRFEEIAQAELAGTSFSTGLDRRERAQERLAQRSAKAPAVSDRPLNGATAIARGKGDRARAFEGATVLDKLVSFIAFLIKSLERKLFGAIRRFFPGHRQQLLKQQQMQLQALSQKKAQSRQAAKKGKTGAASSSR